ncbi:unnamed protein product [Ectocarpus sp. 8 AP-2014]
MAMMRLRAAWPLTFIWVDPERDLKRSPPREIAVEEIVDLARGHKTPAFWQQASHRGIHTLPDPKLCFSLVGHDRSLDLAAESLPEAREWVCALARVALMAKRGGLVEAARDAVAPLLPHRYWPEPAASPAGPDLEEIMSGERLNDVDHEVDSHVGVQRQSDRAATALNTEVSRHEVSLRSDADLSSEIPKVFGEGGAWSVDTIHAWRRRLFPALCFITGLTCELLTERGTPRCMGQPGVGMPERSGLFWTLAETSSWRRETQGGTGRYTRRLPPDTSPASNYCWVQLLNQTFRTQMVKPRLHWRLGAAILPSRGLSGNMLLPREHRPGEMHSFRPIVERTKGGDLPRLTHYHGHTRAVLHRTRRLITGVEIWNTAATRRRVWATSSSKT